jgi:hypothetical protein
MSYILNYVLNNFRFLKLCRGDHASGVTTLALQRHALANWRFDLAQKPFCTSFLNCVLKKHCFRSRFESPGKHNYPGDTPSHERGFTMVVFLKSALQVNCMTCIILRDFSTEEYISSIHYEIKRGQKICPSFICRGDLTRTDDPLHPMQVR